MEKFNISMADKKSLVEEALLQMKNLEDVVTENAKGILASTMKEEISELVKESLKNKAKNKLKEQDEPDTDPDDVDVDPDDVDVDSDDMDMDPDDMDMDPDDMDMDPDDMDMDPDDEMDMDPEVNIDIEDDVVEIPDDASMEDVLSVFKKMGPSDRIIVKKEGDKIHLDDEDEDVEYIISTNESISETDTMSDTDLDQLMNDIFLGEMDEDMGEDDYSDLGEDMDYMMDDDTLGEDMGGDDYSNLGEDDEVVYEISMDKDMDEDMDEDLDEDIMGYSDLGEDDEPVYESKFGMKPIMFSDWKSGKKLGSKTETKESTTTKPKEKEKVETGKEKSKSPFHRPGEKTAPKAKTETKEGMGKFKPKGTGMNLSPKKFEYKEGKKHDISMVEKRIAGAFSKGETKEAARTLGNGTRNFAPRKGLPKMKVIPNSAVREEVESLRQKNVEYQKALNVFREKLNEVAVFNSNLAYATRLFTEHSTSKQEKINILRRFDEVETIKESKNLYNAVKNELTNSNKNVVTESMEKIEKTHSSGSSQNLIESKTYENPQFMRMKDIMQKINK
jgi:hypothetical protein